MSKTPPLLQIKDLSRPMLGPVSLSLAAGDCLCITGESGSGKSQLLRAIADIDPHGGELWLDGVSRRGYCARAVASPGRPFAAGKQLVAAACT